MENDGKTSPPRDQPEACVPKQPRPLTKILGISEESLRILRAEAQRTFEHGAVVDIAFYKALRRPIIVRIVAWYGGAINRAAGQYGQRLAEAAAQRKGFGPEQRQAIQEEVQDFARKKIDQRVVASGWVFFAGTEVSLASPKWSRR